MQHLNKRQRWILWVAVFLAFAMYVYPPKDKFYGEKQIGDAGYMPLWETRVEPSYNVRVAFTRLFIQYGLLCAATCVAFVSSRAKP